MADLFKEYFPHIPTWVNVASVNAGKDIPSNVSFVSATPKYNKYSAQQYKTIINTLKTNNKKKRIMLIGDGIVSKMSEVPNYRQEYKADLLRDYMTIAQCDNKVSGIFMFIWYPNWASYSEVSMMPLLEQEMIDIYNEIYKEK